MGVVLTINRIDQKPVDFNNVVVGKEEIMLEGSLALAETRIYNPNAKKAPLIEAGEEIEEEEDDDSVPVFPDEEIEDDEFIPGGDITDYEKYILKHSQRFPIVGMINQKEFSEILKIYNFDVYMNGSYAISYGKHKGKYAQAAFRRLRKTTEFKSAPLKIDLLDALEKIINSDSGITVQSGWFSNLGLPNLDSVLLRGEDANQGSDWQKFKVTQGASLSNIELLIEDDSAKDNKISISLSAAGILFCKKNISPDKALELTGRIFDIILEEDEEE